MTDPSPQPAPQPAPPAPQSVPPSNVLGAVGARAGDRRSRFAQWMSRLTDHIVRRTRHAPGGHNIGLSALATPVALCLCLALLMRHITPETLSELTQTVAEFSLAQWAVALGLTGLSYLAIGRFEATAHDLAQTGINHKRARRAGMQAVALAQSLGFGTITAAFVRKRALPELGIWPLARLSVVSSMSFLVALGGLALLVLMYHRSGTYWLPASAVAVGIVFARRLRPTPAVPGLTTGRAARTAAWTALDTGLAASILFVFLPNQPEIALMTVICAYLLALGAGLLSQSPGGLGAFELTMVLLLPQVPLGAMLAALLAYRITYHAVPAVVAVATLIPRPQPASLPALTPANDKAAARAAHRAGIGDWGLIHQGAQVLLTRDQSAGWLTRRTPTALVALTSPLGDADLASLDATAKHSALTTLLYKCSARTAAYARIMGWSVAHIADEAMIYPAQWSCDGATRRGLRRKLRSATKSGLRIDPRLGRLPYNDMARVNAAWRLQNGTERGFSMGRFAPHLIARQRVFLAYVGQDLVGFVTFHKTGPEWGLDLMRLAPGAPNGTMQSLVASAIATARQAEVPRLSLAACPPNTPLLNRLSRGHDGRQFKNSFGPKWRRLYAAAPTKRALVAALTDTARCIHWPAPLPGPPRERRRWARGPKFRFELFAPTCDADADTTHPAVAGGQIDATNTRSTPNDQRPHNSPPDQ